VTGSNNDKIKSLFFKVINSAAPAMEVPGSINSPVDLALFMMDLTAGFKKVIIRIDATEPKDMEKLIYTCEPSVLTVMETAKKNLKSLTKITSDIEKEKTLILNSEDPGFDALHKSAKCNVLTFGTKDADICAEKSKKSGFVLNILNEKIEISEKITKEISISDILAAAAAAHAAGLEIDEIKKGLEEISS